MPYVDRTVLTSNDQSSGQVADPNQLEKRDEHIADVVDDNYTDLHEFVNGNNISKLRIVNVQDFGAKGDGVTEDTTSMQDAINEAQNNSKGTVFVPKTNSFYLVDRIEVPSGIKFISDGAEIKLKDNGTNHPINVIGSNVIVEGFEIDGNTSGGNNGHCINFSTNISECHVNNNIVRNAGIDGIHLEDGNKNIKVTGNSCFDCGRNGIALNGNEQSILVAHNYVYNSNDGGINMIGAGTGVSIVNNITDQTNGDGITGYGDGQKELLIEGNVCQNAGNNGVHIGGENVVIANNIFKNNSNRGIYYQNSPITVGEKLLITGNTVDGTTNIHTIQITSCDHVSLTNNTIRNSFSRGISVETANNLIISNNEISDGGSDGVRIDKVTAVTISGNVINNVSNGIHSSDDDVTISKNNVINGNNIQGCSGHGILISNSGDYFIITSNVSKGNTSGQITEGSGTNNVVVNNITA